MKNPAAGSWVSSLGQTRRLSPAFAQSGGELNSKRLNPADWKTAEHLKIFLNLKVVSK